jgi:hypothetical protein
MLGETLNRDTLLAAHFKGAQKNIIKYCLRVVICITDF